MCGIYAVIGNHATKKVFAGLKRIEYRGYDSWGIASLTQNTFSIDKQVGKIGQAKFTDLPAITAAIGHTRWATHGKVTVQNAHPHLAQNKAFVIVHNGVVENYQQLKTQANKDGYVFHTQTDTETILALLEQQPLPLTAETVNQVAKKLTGRNSFAILTKEGVIWAYRFGSPLILGKSERNVILSSDLSALAADATEYYHLDHQDLIKIDPDGTISLWQNGDKKVNIIWQPMTISTSDIALGKWPHFMLKEIFEQPIAFKAMYLENKEQLNNVVQLLEQAQNIYIIGAGSASFAAFSLTQQLRQLGLNAYHLPSYEAELEKTNFSAQTLAIVISQSGETADTLEVVEWLKTANSKIVSLVNNPSSTLAGLSDLCCQLATGPEIGVASTKALTTQILWGILLSQTVQKIQPNKLEKSVEQLSTTLTEWLNQDSTIKELNLLAHTLKSFPDLFILGRNRMLPVAMECALKLKEVSLVHAEALSAGELKHGVLAIINENSYVMALSDSTTQVEILNACAEVKARGAKIIGISPIENELFDIWINVPKHELFQPVLNIIPIQILSYQLALIKKLDPDKPKNLAKSVTVK